MKYYHPGKNSRPAAFTLIEIMVVLAVIAIIATMAVPAMNGVLKGSKINQATDGFERDIARARSAARRDNSPIEFRFYKFRDPEQPNSSNSYRAYQAVKRVLDPENHSGPPLDVEPIFEVRLLPPGIIFSEDETYSTLLKIPDLPRNTAKDWGQYNDSVPRVEEAEYKAFYFRPDGSTDLTAIDPSEHWCVTILKEDQAQSELPPDFVTFQVDAYNGQVRRYEKRL